MTEKLTPEQVVYNALISHEHVGRSVCSCGDGIGYITEEGRYDFLEAHLAHVIISDLEKYGYLPYGGLTLSEMVEEAKDD